MAVMNLPPTENLAEAGGPPSCLQELGEEVRGGARGGAEVGEVEALVLAVGVAGRVLEAEEQRRDSAHHLREGADEGDGAAAADLDGLAAEARREPAARRRE